MGDSINELAKYFESFPGIGARQARRFVYFLLTKDKAYLDKLAALLTTLKKNTAQCPICFRFFENDRNELCDICANSKTDKKILMIIEKDADLESMKRSKIYAGRYFVLGGLVPVVENETKKLVRIEQLKDRVKKSISEDELSEIILAFSLSPQGEHTDLYVRRELSPLIEKSKIKIASLGRGLSTGTELEYSDSETLKNAMKNRQ